MGIQKVLEQQGQGDSGVLAQTQNLGTAQPKEKAGSLATGGQIPDAF